MILEHRQIIYTIIIGFFITLILGPLIIPFLKRLKVGQTVREEAALKVICKKQEPLPSVVLLLLHP